LNLQIPIYEHSTDLRNELMILKRFPFQVKVKLENSRNELIAKETLQTYLEIHNNAIRIVGKVVKSHSKFY
jgi:hypothetical protein